MPAQLDMQPWNLYLIARITNTPAYGIRIRGPNIEQLPMPGSIILHIYVYMYNAIIAVT